MVLENWDREEGDCCLRGWSVWRYYIQEEEEEAQTGVSLQSPQRVSVNLLKAPPSRPPVLR